MERIGVTTIFQKKTTNPLRTFSEKVNPILIQSPNGGERYGRMGCVGHEVCH